jgi:hypothetical protein
MKLKIIIFPFVLIMTIIMAVNFIYPDYQKIQTVRTEIEGKEAELANLEAKSQNVKKLASDLESNETNRDFVMRYLPEKKNEEVIVDRSNYLTIDSSVLLVNVDLEEIKAPVVQGPSAEEQALLDRNAQLTGQSNVVQSIPDPPFEVDKLGATVELIGTYENIKTYLNRLYRIENWFDINSLEIELVNNDNEESQGSEANQESTSQGSNEVKNLVVRYNLNFGYFPKVNIKVNQIPQIFTQSNFDFSAAEKAREISTSVIPDIDAGSYGSRTNPFFP